MSRGRLTIGDEVAHIDNLSVKLRVRKVVFLEKKLSHIECSWWSNAELLKDNFHSHELILWGIAKQGEDQVKSYLENLEKELRIENMNKNERS